MKPMFLILVFVSLAGYAQEKKWTLPECMQYAVENSPRVNKQQARNNIHDQNYKEAVGQLLPSVDFGTNAYFNFGRGLDASTNTYIDVNSFNNNYEAYSSLLLFNGLANVTKAKMQKMSKLMGKQQLQETRDMVTFETMEAFFYVLYCKGLVQLSQQQYNETTESLRQIKRMEELGMKGIADVAEIQAKEAADNYNLTRQKNQQTISIIQLKEKMNFPVDQNIDVEDYASDEMVMKSNESALSVYEKAKGFLPRALAAESSYRAQKLSYHSSIGSLFPTLTINGGYSTNFFRFTNGTEYMSFAEQLDEKRGYYAGITLSIPIFKGFSKSAQMQRSKQQMIISKTERDETFRSIYSEIEQALADMNGQADEYYQATRQVEATEMAHKINQRKYTEGLINAIDIQTSSNRLLQAKVERLNALLKYYLKKKLVDYYKSP